MIYYARIRIGQRILLKAVFARNKDEAIQTLQEDYGFNVNIVSIREEEVQENCYEDSCHCGCIVKGR